jgi:hypothetical protein
VQKQSGFQVISQFRIKIVWLQYMNTLMQSGLLCCWFQFSLSLKVCPSWNFFAGYATGARWGELLSCSNNYWKKEKCAARELFSYQLSLSRIPIWKLNWQKETVKDAKTVHGNTTHLQSQIALMGKEERKSSWKNRLHLTSKNQLKRSQPSKNHLTPSHFISVHLPGHTNVVDSWFNGWR